MSNDREFGIARERVERRVLSGAVRDTFSLPRSYAQTLGYSSEYEMRENIRGRRVCNLASGLGGLEVGLDVDGFETDITPVNPRAVLRGFQIRAAKAARDSSLIKFYPPLEIERAIERYQARVVPDFAHRLSLRDGEFEILFDKDGVFHSARPEDEPVLSAAVDEMTRVVPPGGEIRIGARRSFGNLERGLDNRRSFKEELLLKKNIPYTLNWDNTRGLVRGVTIRR